MLRALSLSTAILLAGIRPQGYTAHAQQPEGFTVYDPSSLDVSLGSSCIEALSATINCVPWVQTFTQLSYRGSLELELTDAVCSADCGSSLKTWFDSVATQCAGQTLDGAIPTKFGGFMWAGYNETCIRDPRPPKPYCNDVIDKFSDVPDIQSMPRAELCHDCHIRRLAEMQSSQYSIYDEFYQERLEYVYATCGGKVGPTDIPPPLDKVQPAPAPYCVTNKRYTTKQGDTCESIAGANSVSAAVLYMGNQALIPDCQALPARVTICIPPTCQTYQIRPSDTCTSIEIALQMDFGLVLQYNSWLDPACSNLQSATDFYGKVVCVSPQGGTWSGTIPNPADVPSQIKPDGYSKETVQPPRGNTVAEGTTMNCGKWHVVSADDSCTTICVKNGIEASLFHEVNPSLASGTSCDGSLQQDSALCVGPTYNWKTAEVASSDILK